MKKKLLLALILTFAFVCLLAIGVSAATPSMYVQFDVKLDGNSEYTKAYVENTSDGNPRVDLTLDFYSDVEFTTTIEKSQITAMDFSNVVTYGDKRGYVDRFTTADPSVFPKCAEIKWFSHTFTSAPSTTFNNWTQLKSFDFGCIEVIDYNFLTNTGLTEVVLPASVTTLKNSVFYNCKELVSVTVEGGLTSIGTTMFQGCEKLKTVDLGNTTYIRDGMFKGCAALETVHITSNITNIEQYAFQNCSSLKTISLDNLNQEYAVFIPEGVENISQLAFQNCSSIKYLSLPSTLTYLGAATFNGCSALEFVDFNDNQNDINFYNYGTFLDCVNLKAISLPDGVKIINNRVLSNCNALQAVYLPASLEQINTNGNGQGAFCYSEQMYFVQNSFEVRGEDGKFLGESFQMPKKPDVYYMPSNLSKAGGNASSGTWFRDCFALNKTIVMPVAFTNSTVSQMFRNTASSTNVKNIVYLGDMEGYVWSEQNHDINFVFANPNDKDISSITFTSFYNKNNNNARFYFCSTGYSYSVNVSSADLIAATKEENSYCHIHSPRADKTTEATYVDNAKYEEFCFCGHAMKTEVQENTALFNVKGYSKNGDSLVYVVVVNATAIANYNEAKGVNIKYGIVASQIYNDGDLISTEGTVKDNTVLGADFTGTDYSILKIKVTGAASNADTALHCCAYVTDGAEVAYLYESEGKATKGNKANQIKYSDIVDN